MAFILTSGQARARGLYDEQLQRQQQEKKLLRAARISDGERPAFFGSDSCKAKI